MTYATDLVRANNIGAQQTSGTIRRGVIYLTVVAIAMIAVAGGALAALGA
jgi:hypothetical protein